MAGKSRAGWRKGERTEIDQKKACTSMDRLVEEGRGEFCDTSIGRVQSLGLSTRASLMRPELYVKRFYRDACLMTLDLDPFSMQDSV